MTPAQTFIRKHGIVFKVERNSAIIAEYQGLPNHEKSTSKQYIAFAPNADIQSGDWIINPTGQKLFVLDTSTTYVHGESNQLKAYYETYMEHKSKNESATNIFNIGTATGSVIGLQSIVHMSYNESIQDAKQKIESSNSNDKEELRQILNLLEMIVNNQIPPQKGLFSKFSDVLERNSWITSSIASALLSWLTAQIPPMFP